MFEDRMRYNSIDLAVEHRLKYGSLTNLRSMIQHYQNSVKSDINDAVIAHLNEEMARALDNGSFSELLTRRSDVTGDIRRLVNTFRSEVGLTLDSYDESAFDAIIPALLYAMPSFNVHFVTIHALALGVAVGFKSLNGMLFPFLVHPQLAKDFQISLTPISNGKVLVSGLSDFAVRDFDLALYEAYLQVAAFSTDPKHRFRSIKSSLCNDVESYRAVGLAKNSANSYSVAFYTDRVFLPTRVVSKTIKLGDNGINPTIDIALDVDAICDPASVSSEIAFLRPSDDLFLKRFERARANRFILEHSDGYFNSIGVTGFAVGYGSVSSNSKELPAAKTMLNTFRSLYKNFITNAYDNDVVDKLRITDSYITMVLLSSVWR